MTFTTRPPYDPELSTVLNGLQDIIPSRLTFTNLPKFQEKLDELWTAEAAIAGTNLRHEEISIPSLDNSNIVLSIFSPCASGRADESPRPRPCIVWFHGGGMLLSNRFIGIQVPLAWATASDAIVVSVEYRVAPAHPAPKAVEDCYAAISWICTSVDASRFGIDKARILIAGCSAGGGLAAGVSLMVRDHTLAGARACIVGLVLISPMLDDRVDEEFAKQFCSERNSVWSTESNELAWRAVLGHQYGSENVSSWVVPGRAQDVSGLPRIYLDVGSVDLFREQCVGFTSRVWRVGGDLALHVWPGAFHGFDTLAPSAALSLKSTAARTDWVRDVLALE
ncbi:alpha/beta hydrolase domain protein [Xylariaceae sp. FL0255]|nr:alpha/beta hydrolase domain protein [Xylariaceae sp. FL0255]